jgi:chromosome segregation ATPase
MNGNEQDTEPTLRTIVEMLTALRKDVSVIGVRLESLESRMGNLESRMGNLESRLDNLESRVEQGFEAIRLQLVGVEVQLERNEALTHKALFVAKNASADTKVLTEEVRSWAKDVQRLMRPLV